MGQYNLEEGPLVPKGDIFKSDNLHVCRSRDVDPLEQR